VKCCGEERTTPFCPMCGKAAQRHGLRTLLRHLFTQQTQIENRIAAYRRAKDGVDDSLRGKYLQEHPEVPCRRIVSLTRNLEKWQTWHDELAKLLAERTEKQEEAKP